MRLELIGPLLDPLEDGFKCIQLLNDEIQVIIHKVYEATPEHPYIDDFGVLR